MSSRYCRGEVEIGKKFLAFAMIFVGLVFFSFIFTRVVPLLPIPPSFLGWFLLFLLMMIFFFFYAAYKSI
jgi:hypothetical protein